MKAASATRVCLRRGSKNTLENHYHHSPSALTIQLDGANILCLTKYGLDGDSIVMLTLYQEIAFAATPPTSASLLEFQIPRKDGSYDKSKFSKNHAKERESYIKDEASYSSHFLASQSSIYFRQAKTYPRTFLWKVVSDGRALQVRCADLARGEDEQQEAYITLSFVFQDDISPSGVSLADFDTGDELYVFVCTRGKEIFSLQIPTTAFQAPDAISNDVAQWCKPLDLSSLVFETVHQLYASTPFEFFLSFASGRVQKVTRRSKDDNWKPDMYDDKSWSASIRGMVSRRGGQAIEYGPSHLDIRTVQGMTASTDGNYLFTICLNHQLRVWHLASGRLVVTKDLLDIQRDPQDRIQLNPHNTAFVQLFKLPLQKNPVLVTYSPHEGGQFKFWDVRGGLTDTLTLEDKYPGVKLSPPDPDPSGNTVWSLAGFHVQPGDDFKPSQIWVLWRNNNYHQLYSLHYETNDLVDAWKSNWIQTATNFLVRPAPPDLVRSDSEDVTSKWIDFLLFPGRYPDAVLETALNIYQTAKTSPITIPKSAPLKQRLCSIIASAVSLRKYEDSELDYDRFTIDTDSNWRSFWRVVENVNDGRHLPISLSYDSFSEMTWILMAGKCCAVRECTVLELLQKNEAVELEHLEEVTASRWPHRKVSTDDGEPFQKIGQLIRSARRFREAFTPELSKDLYLTVGEEVLANSEFVSTMKIFELYDSISFGDSISNDIYDRLEADLQLTDGLASLNNEIFLAVLETSVTNSKRSSSALRSTLFGQDVLSAGLLDCLIEGRQLLWDLLALTIFVEGELNQEDEKLVAFDAPELFSQIVPVLRDYERNLWLATHTRHVPLEFLSSSVKSNASRRKAKLAPEHSRVTSILEDILSKDIRPQPAIDRPLMYLITDLLADTQQWISGRDTITPEDGAVYLQCDLIAQGNIDFATEFLSFQPSTAWATYVKGRLYLVKGEHNAAAQYFQRAAYGLAYGKALGNLTEVSAGLVSTLEVECFNHGLAHYLQHVLSLFESSQAYAQVAQFAGLALQAMTSSQKEPFPNFRSEVLSRLFTAELKNWRFEAAFDALVQFSDHALQSRGVISLLDEILNPSSPVANSLGRLEIIQSLPWGLYPRLGRQVDQHLSSLAQKQKYVMTGKNKSFPMGGHVDYLRLVHAIRLSQNDYRGAVSALFDQLKLIKRSGRARNDPQSTEIRRALLALINAMTCIAPEEAYILAEVDDELPNLTSAHSEDMEMKDADDSTKSRKRRRIIITLDDLRRDYQQLLDKCSRIERGDFEFDFDGESEDDGDEMENGQSHLNGVGSKGDAMVL